MKRWLATLALLGVTTVWGWTFVLVRDAVLAYDVMGFLAIRFAIAAVAVLVVAHRRLSRRALGAGLAIGLVLAAGYLLQTWGLKLTTATNSGLITGLFVVIGPLADRLLYGARLPRHAVAAVTLSLAGMILLTGGAPRGLALGDLLTLGCAVAFGVHIAVLSHASPRFDPLALTAAQMLSIAAVFSLLWPLSGPVTAPPREVWFALGLTGLVASALAYLIQTFAQRHLSTARTAVILTMEPVFAGMFGYLLAGERLARVQWAGAVMILAAVLLSEVLPALRTGAEG
ncbi:MAG TPA: DMT family transporter [Acidobacteria bacterium]|nr:DMT family transporter [Acidobacteriota bacterium]